MNVDVSEVRRNRTQSRGGLGKLNMGKLGMSTKLGKREISTLGLCWYLFHIFITDAGNREWWIEFWVCSSSSHQLWRLVCPVSLFFEWYSLLLFFVLLHACLSLPLSVQAVKQEVCWHASFSFYFWKTRGRKKPTNKSFKFSIEEHYHEIITGWAW